MTTGAVEVQPTRRAPLADDGSEVSLRIICPTYWYPQHATDTQATYVHDINRHLARRGHRVTVVTPGNAIDAGRRTASTAWTSCDFRWSCPST